MYPQNAKEFREYKNRLEQHETAIEVSPCYCCNGFTGAETAYLSKYDWIMMETGKATKL